MFDEDYKKFVMALMKPGEKMEEEMSHEEKELFYFSIFLGAEFESIYSNGGYDSSILSRISKESEKLSVSHMLVGILGEIGEIVDCIKKACVYRKEIDVNNFIEEISDICFYTCALIELVPNSKTSINFFLDRVKHLIHLFNSCYNISITIEQCIEHNKQKLSVRYKDGKYSDKAAKERADKQ